MNNPQSETAILRLTEAPSQEDFDVAALCLEGEGRRPWHIHPEDSAAVLRVAEWIKSRITLRHLS